MIILQFIFRKHGELKANHLQDVSIGQKDFHKGLFHVLKSIFQLPKPNRKHFGFLQQVPKTGFVPNSLALSGIQSDIGSTTMQTSNSIRFHNVLHLASSNSEFEKVAQGMYTNAHYYNFQAYLDISCLILAFNIVPHHHLFYSLILCLPFY